MSVAECVVANKKNPISEVKKNKTHAQIQPQKSDKKPFADKVIASLASSEESKNFQMRLTIQRKDKRRNRFGQIIFREFYFVIQSIVIALL